MMLFDKLELTAKQRDLLLAFFAFVLALLLWQVQGLFFVTYPFRLFVTMIHELGHGLAAVLTGGSFLHFEVTQRGAGLAYTSGGSRFLIVQAGYLGTALFGAVLLYTANRTARPGVVAVVLGLLLGVLTLLYSGLRPANLNLIETVIVACLIIVAFYLILTRETDPGRYAGLTLCILGVLLMTLFAGSSNTLLTVGVGVGSAAVLIIIGLSASRGVALVTVNFLAFLTGLQAITDAWVLLQIVAPSPTMMPRNDAATMAELAGGPAAMWALWWIVADVLIFGAAVYITFVRPIRQANSARSQ